MSSQQRYLQQAANNVIAEPADYNALQERALRVPSLPSVAVGAAAPDTDPSDAVDAGNVARKQTGPGGQSRFYLQSTGVLGAGKIVVVDDTVDWRDRLLVLPYFFVVTDVTQLPGGVNDGTCFSIARNAQWATDAWYTGTGALSSLGANPAPGHPPTPGYMRYLLDTTAFASPANLILYVENKTPFRLCAYNEASASGRALLLWLEASSPLGKR